MFALCCLLACLGASPNESADSAPGPSHYVLTGGTVVGIGKADVEVADGKIVAVGASKAVADRIDVSGRYLAPGWIDSHVHLAYLQKADAMADGGIAAAVDLAAPIEFLQELPTRPHILAAGPMITASGGYPTESWGRNGFGLECKDVASVRAAVKQLKKAGAGVIKVPVTDSPSLDDAQLLAAVEEAHALGLKVAAHALSDDEAARAALAGADVLAHTPVSALSKNTIALWSNRAVISTLAAFGGSDAAIENLRALRAAGATVLYGTDFGNTTVAGIDPDELALLGEAGLDGAAIVAAGTTTPAAFWGLGGFGTLTSGAEAHILVLDADPTVDATTLTRLVQVF